MVQAGADSIIQFNIDGDSSPEMAILIKDVTPNQVHAADFIL